MSNHINEHDMVVLLHDLPGEPVMAGDIGCAVHVHKGGVAYEVEFENPGGKPRYLVLTVEAKDLLKLRNVERLAG